jgi:hypothetical protein
MAEVAVKYPDEPSRRALGIASGIVLIGGAFVIRRLPSPHRQIATYGRVLLVKPLAMFLTRRGL